MPETQRLRQRWFAALLAAHRLETECGRLLDALRRADDAWRRACVDLAALESLAEELENQLGCQDEPLRPRPAAPRYAVISAA